MKKLIAALFLLTALSAFGQAQTNRFAVTLTWDKNPEPDVNSYIVYHKTNAASAYVPIATVSTNSASISNLLANTTNWFVVTAVNTSGLESDYSNEAVSSLPGRPSAPKNNRILTTIRVTMIQTQEKTYVTFDGPDDGMTVLTPPQMVLLP